MTTCHKIQARLSAYLDDTLDAAKRREVDAHLAACRTCAREMARLKSMLGMLKRVAPVAAPDHFEQALHRRLQSQPPSKRTFKRILASFRLKRPLQLATAAALAVMLFMVINTPLVKKQMSPTTISQTTRKSAPADAIEKRPASGIDSEKIGRAETSDEAREADRDTTLSTDTLEQAASPPPTPRSTTGDLVRPAKEERAIPDKAFTPRRPKGPVPTQAPTTVAPEPLAERDAQRVGAEMKNETPRPAPVLMKPKVRMGEAKVSRKPLSLVVFLAPTPVARADAERQTRQEESMGAGQAPPRASRMADAEDRPRRPGRAPGGSDDLKALLQAAGAVSFEIIRDPAFPHITRIQARIPARAYENLIARLMHIGELRQPYPRIDTTDETLIEIEIQLIGPRN